MDTCTFQNKSGPLSWKVDTKKITPEKEIKKCIRKKPPQKNLHNIYIFLSYHMWTHYGSPHTYVRGGEQFWTKKTFLKKIIILIKFFFYRGRSIKKIILLFLSLSCFFVSTCRDPDWIWIWMGHPLLFFLERDGGNEKERKKILIPGRNSDPSSSQMIFWFSSVLCKYLILAWLQKFRGGVFVPICELFFNFLPKIVPTKEQKIR